MEGGWGHARYVGVRGSDPSQHRCSHRNCYAVLGRCTGERGREGHRGRYTWECGGWGCEGGGGEGEGVNRCEGGTHNGDPILHTHVEAEGSSPAHCHCTNESSIKSI